MEEIEMKMFVMVDIMKIMKLLLYWYLFLLIDWIIEMDGDDSCIGVKNVIVNEL